MLGGRSLPGGGLDTFCGMKVPLNGGVKLQCELWGTESRPSVRSWARGAEGGRVTLPALLSGSFGDCLSQGNTFLLNNP